MKSYFCFGRNFLKYFFALVTLFGIVILLIYTDTCKDSVTEGINACTGILVPSLFPFFFLSSFIVYTDSLSVLTKPLYFAEKIFDIPRAGIGAVILSLIGGYPVGAKTVSALYRENKITYYTAKKLCYCCVGSGSGFLVTFIGEGIFLSKKFGILLLISNAVSVISVLLLSRLNSLFRKNKESSKEFKVSEKIVENNSRLNLGDAVVLATENAVKTTLSMCGIVVIFIVINNLLALIPLYNGYLALALEITGGLIKYGKGMTFETIAFITGFGGICVHFQIYGIAGKIKINKLQFVFARIVQGGISALVLHILLLLFPVTRETFSSLTSAPNGTFSGTLWGGGAIILLSIVFLITIKKQEVNLCAE